MPNIKPVSDLRNYEDALRDVFPGRPLFLTRDGRGCYAILDMEEYHEIERMRAMDQLMAELEKGRRSGEEEGYFTLEEVERELGIANE